eukprot:ANDGO_05979.mRNA.1 hypothetical protein
MKSKKKLRLQNRKREQLHQEIEERKENDMVDLISAFGISETARKPPLPRTRISTDAFSLESLLGMRFGMNSISLSGDAPRFSVGLEEDAVTGKETPAAAKVQTSAPSSAPRVKKQELKRGQKQRQRESESRASAYLEKLQKSAGRPDKKRR